MYKIKCRTRRDSRLIYFSRPFPARRGRPHGSLLAGNNFCRTFPSLGNWCVDGLTPLFEMDISSRDVVSILAVVSPYLKPQNDVKDKCEEETRQHKGVLNLGGSGEQPGETTKDLRYDSKGGQLSSRPCPVVLRDLGELGEQPKREGGHLEERDRFFGKVNQRANQGGGGNGCASNLWQVAWRGR